MRGEISLKKNMSLRLLGLEGRQTTTTKRLLGALVHLSRTRLLLYT